MPTIHGLLRQKTGPTSLKRFPRRMVTGGTCQSGFTLLELLIATAVLTIGLLSTASLLLLALSSHFNSNIEAAALRMTQSTLEELKSLPLNHAELIDSTESLTANFDIDFSATQSPVHARTTLVTLNQFRSTQIQFETRWHVQTSADRKVITSATRKIGAPASRFQPVSMKIVRLYTAPSLGL